MKTSRKNSDVGVPFGLSRSTGKLYEPRAVPLGKICDCICPACKEPLYSKHCHGEKVTPHFMHAAGANCKHGYETAIHLAAKQLIEERKILALPSLFAHVQFGSSLYDRIVRSTSIVSEGVRNLNNVTLEKSIGDFRPDLIVTIADIGEVLVEIAVTHLVTSSKLEKIVRRQLPVLEIDLSKMRNITFNELENALFVDISNSSWIFHPSVAGEQEKLRELLLPLIEEAKQESSRQKIIEDKKKREKRIADQQRFAAEYFPGKWNQTIPGYESSQRAATFKNRSDDGKLLAVTKWLKIQSIPESVKIHIPGVICFGCVDQNIWQLALFSGLIHRQINVGMKTISVDSALNWLRQRFNFDAKSSENERMAVQIYLDGLLERGALVRANVDFFNIAVLSLESFELLHKFKLGHISLNADLQWVDESSWPEKSVSILLAVPHSLNATREWELLSNLRPSCNERTPKETCSWFERISGNAISENAVASYLIGAGFLIEKLAN
ncbi:MAG: hypothetical protein Q7K26_06055 [bacterium]|nr:hypothetical protein [bacterium]